MIAFNIFTWIGDLFKNVLFVPFNDLRLELATQEVVGGYRMQLTGSFYSS